MNAPTSPPEEFEPIIKNARRFNVPMQFSAEHVALIAPLWRGAFETNFEVPAFGPITIGASQTLSRNEDTLFLTVKVARHLFYIGFSSAEWLDTLLRAFEDGIRFADFPQAAALAFEANLAGTITQLEKIIGHDVTFLALSETTPDLDIENLPKATFDITFDKLGSAQASLRGADKAAHDMLVELLTNKTTQQPAPAPKTSQKIAMNTSLIANAMEMSYEQLRKIQPGEGFILGAAWMAQTSFNLVVTDKVLATVKKVGGVFTIDETFVENTPQAAPIPTPGRRARRMKRERAKSNG